MHLPSLSQFVPPERHFYLPSFIQHVRHPLALLQMAPIRCQPNERYRSLGRTRRRLLLAEQPHRIEKPCPHATIPSPALRNAVALAALRPVKLNASPSLPQRQALDRTSVGISAGPRVTSCCSRCEAGWIPMQAVFDSLMVNRSVGGVSLLFKQVRLAEERATSTPPD